MSVESILADPRAQTKPWMPYIAIGSGTTIAGYDSALESELYRKEGTVEVIKNTYFIHTVFGRDEPNQDGLEIGEIGVFDAASGGEMAERWVLDTVVEKDNADEIPVECALTFIRAL